MKLGDKVVSTQYPDRVFELVWYKEGDNTCAVQDKTLRAVVKVSTLRDYFDFGIMHVADKRYNDGLKVDDKIENVKVGVWLERFWYGLENNNLLL